MCPDAVVWFIPSTDFLQILFDSLQLGKEVTGTGGLLAGNYFIVAFISNGLSQRTH